MKLPRRAYDRYMRSPEWLERRQRFLDEHPDGCAICRSLRGLHVHHLDYRHLGAEPDDDLIALCGLHHDALHAYYERHRAEFTLREATSYFIEANEGDAPPPGEPLPPLRNGDRWLELVTVPCPTCEAQPGEACVYEHRGRVRIVTAGGAHKQRKAAANRARRLAS